MGHLDLNAHSRSSDAAPHRRRRPWSLIAPLWVALVVALAPTPADAALCMPPLGGSPDATATAPRRLRQLPAAAEPQPDRHRQRQRRRRLRQLRHRLQPASRPTRRRRRRDACDNCLSSQHNQLDTDGDGVGDAATTARTCQPDQTDTDGDGIGDACDPDDDNDGINDVVCAPLVSCDINVCDPVKSPTLCVKLDNCRLIPNPLQVDATAMGSATSATTARR